MPEARVTAADVARAAGVSQPTVSRVFSPGGRVSADKDRRVRDAARLLGYRPNTVARSLNTGRSNTIGIVLAYLDNPFYPQALQKLSERLSAHGYHVMVFFTRNQVEEIDAVVESFLDHQVDGIILASVSLSNDLTDRLRGLNVPCILFNRGQEGAALPMVTAANFAGGYIAGSFLAMGGHRRIAHISGWLGSMTGRERQAGFIAGLAAHGQQPWRLMESRYNRGQAQEATRAFFADGTGPDAIFVGNDHMAFSVLETLRHELSLSVPGDVSVVGYDDVDMAAWPTFDLTTLRQPANRMVDETVRLLLDMIESGERPASRCEIESTLMIRGTARVPENWSDFTLPSDIDSFRRAQ